MFLQDWVEEEEDEEVDPVFTGNSLRKKHVYISVKKLINTHTDQVAESSPLSQIEV